MHDFEAFRIALSSRSEWAAYSRGLETVANANHPELQHLSSKLMGWAKQFLGDDSQITLAEGYVSFVADVNRSQIRYERRGHYENRTYQDVFDSFYNNNEIMRKYHWGVYATTFAWLHHLDLARFFRERFIEDRLDQQDDVKVVDLGCGSGLWSFLALDSLPRASAHAVDISQTSSRVAAEMADAIGLGGRIHIHCADALSWGKSSHVGTFSAGISCFLLEHLEQPKALLENLARLLRPHGTAFVTGALTAAETDHITEFRRESEIVSLAEAAGFRVMETVSAAPPAYLPNGKFLPRSMAMVLSKRKGDVW